MAVDLDIWLHILSNSITLWMNIICDMIENPEREIYQNISRELYRSILRQLYQSATGSTGATGNTGPT